VHGYLPHFYARPSNAFTKEDVPHFKDILNSSIKREILRSMNAIFFHDFVSNFEPVVSVELFKASELNNIYDFHLTSDVIQREPVILKITCAFSQ